MASRQRPRWATLIPNSTCSRAFDRVSAHAGTASATAPNTTNALSHRIFIENFIEDLRPLERTEQAMCHEYSGGNKGFLNRSATRIYETWSTLSTGVDD